MSRDVVRPENENVAAMRLDEIVAELIDENLVAGVDGAARDHLAAAGRRSRARP